MINENDIPIKKNFKCPHCNHDIGFIDFEEEDKQ